ncbi:MAG: hypothetical protein ABIS30_05575 [Gallionella sp.]
MDTSINLFVGRTAVSRALSFLAYQFDMSRHSLRGSLRFIPINKFLKVSIAFSRVKEAAAAR